MPVVIEGGQVRLLPYTSPTTRQRNIRSSMQRRALAGIPGMARAMGLSPDEINQVRSQRLEAAERMAQEEQSRRAREYAMRQLHRLRQVQEFLPEELQQMAGVGGALMEAHDPAAAWREASQAFANFSRAQGHDDPRELLRNLLMRSNIGRVF